MPAFSLSGSVGDGGKNDPADVAALRSHLNSLGYNWLASGSGIDGELLDAINLLQSIRLGRDVRRGDGRVDVPGKTYTWLRAENAPRWQQMPAGAAGSDHITAQAADLDYRSAASRRKAEKRLRELYRDEEWLQVSLGLGGRSTHVGLHSPDRRRDWTYSSYTP